MITTFKFGYGSKDCLATQVNCARLHPLVREGCPFREGMEKYPFHGEYTGDFRVVMREFPGAEITIVVPEIGPTAWEAILLRLERIENGRLGPLATTHNEHVKVIVSDLGLLYMRYVEVLEDCCTTELQRYLNKGWRILAVCPQASRRPDYVIGRHVDHDTTPPDSYLPPEADDS